MKSRLKNTAFQVVFILFLYFLSGTIFYFAITKEYTPLNNYFYIRFITLLLFAPILIKYIFHLFLAPWYSFAQTAREKKYKDSYTPSVSVLIPAWNEEIGIEKTIRSVLNTNYSNLEVIVINDGSTDKTHLVVSQFLKQYIRQDKKNTVPVYYKRLSNGGKSRALNAGLSIAKGEIIITIDADSIMDKHAIINMVKHFSDSRVTSVAGNVIIGNRSKLIGLIQQLEYLYGFYFKRADSLMNAVYIVGGAAAAYRRNIIIALGGFDEDIITEDIELSTRLQSFGHVIRYAADSIVYTEGPMDFKALCNQRLRWKFGRLLTFYKYRRLFFSLDVTHNFYLSFFILPIALFAEILLFFEGVLLAVFFTYTFYTHDFVPLAFVIFILASVITMQVITDHRMQYHKNLLFLAPIAWILFYYMDLVEYQALIRSIRRIFSKEKLLWQKWKRVGVSFENIT